MSASEETDLRDFVVFVSLFDNYLQYKNPNNHNGILFPNPISILSEATKEFVVSKGGSAVSLAPDIKDALACLR